MPTISGTVYDETGTAVAGRVVRAYRRDTGGLLGGTVSSDGSPTPGDSDFANVSLLLHMEGDPTTDSSGTPKTMTLGSGTQLVAEGARFGAQGLKSSPAGATVPSHSDFALPGDFTLECWFYAISFSPVYASLFNIGQFSSGALFRVQPDKLELYINGNVYNAVTAVSSGAWHHAAWSRTGATVSVFLDGVLAGTASDSGSIPAGGLTIGVSAHNSGEYLHGYLDEIRLTKGVGRYSSNFTPPALPFPDSAVGSATAVGSYSIPTTHAGEVNVVCLDDTAGTAYNDLILRTTPV
ncbi:LamG-like jellyroll fold domain-containing protein [Rhodoferax sp.]|uniref:LamG domain-containing protein n=1 Tax=Rhodoferax sp. TaxID=50421 RepID=UPI00260B2A99|nr:LamG-like jellyroll fold domain-containing protein [Rhodoferax sp.]MDD2927062.1 hypothetical protein [Rhodoferax sp.]